MRKVTDSDSIVVTNAVRNSEKMIRTKCEFFSNKAVVCEIKDNCLLVRLPYFDEPKVTSVNSIGKGWYRMFLTCDIPNGIYKMEEDSTEDVKIFYFGN